MEQAQQDILPEFENPPVSEVVCGIVFEPVEQFAIHHVGLFWEVVKDEFPICENAARLGFSPAQLDLKDYLPRVWFVCKEQDRLIQLQNDRFFFNWRKTEIEEFYPRYRKIIKAFGDNLGRFKSFLKENNLGSIKPKRCELSYINHIPQGDGWESLGDIAFVFRDFAWDSSERFLPEPDHLEGQAVFLMEKELGTLSIKLQRAERKEDKLPTLRLDISAHGLGEDKSMAAVWSWFEIAHKWIVKGFADVTTKDVQESCWQRIS